MKKLLSVLLAVLMIFSVMAPITVFAENGPYPNDFENVDIENIDVENFKMSAVLFMDLTAMFENPEEAIGLVYPADDALPLPSAFKGASYDIKTNTLTLKNVRAENAILGVLAMGDDFKIKLVGYNELGSIASSGMEWGGSITLTGNGELVLNKTKENFSAIEISADNTASFFRAEKNVNLKFYSAPEYDGCSIYIEGSTITDASQLIQLEGNVKQSGSVTSSSYTVDVYEQVSAHDVFFSTYEYCDAVFTKEDTGETLYAGFESYDVETYEPDGKYYIYSLEYDEILGCYVGTPVGDEEVSVDAKAEGYTVVMDGVIPATIENIFIPEEPYKFNLALSEDGTTKYGFEVYEYYDDNYEITKEYTIYTLTEHPTYGLIAKEVPNKTDIEGLVPQKIGENTYCDAYIETDITMNNGGSVLPKAVKLVSATNHADGVKIKWTPLSNATKYRVYRKAAGEKSWKALTTLSGSSTSSYIDTTAKSGIKYTYTVKAYNIVGWGSYNKTGVSVTHVAAPEVTAKNTSSGIKLNWAKVGGATKYRVYRQTSGSSKWTLLDTLTGTSFTDKTAKSGKTYSYRVRAVKGSVVSGYNTVKQLFLATPKLSSVKNTASGVKITWNKVSGAEGYKVYRKTGSGSWKLLKTTTNNSSFTYTDKTASSGKKYSYTVKAYNAKTYSAYNKTGLAITHLEAPEFTVKGATNGVKVSWSKVSGATKYRIYRKASGEKSWTKLTETTKLSYTDKTAKSGKTYYYAVRAIGKTDSSAYNSVKILFLAAPKLSSVENTRNGVEFKWGKVSGAKGYKVYRKTGSGGWKLIATTKKTTYTDSTAKSGTVYTYTVRAYNDSATSYYNKTGLKIRFVDTNTFYTPDNVEDGVQLRWHDADKVDKYYIYREVDGTNTKKQIAVLDPDDLKRDEYGVLMYVDKTAKNGETYAYYMRVLYKNTYSGYTWSTGKYVTRMESVDVISATATSNGIKIKWEKNPYATGYTILRKEKGSDDGAPFYAGTDGSNSTTYLDENVKSGKTYTYSVIAIYNKNNGKGGWSVPGGSKSAKAK